MQHLPSQMHYGIHKQLLAITFINLFCKRHWMQSSWSRTLVNSVYFRGSIRHIALISLACDNHNCRCFKHSPAFCPWACLPHCASHYLKAFLNPWRKSADLLTHLSQIYRVWKTGNDNISLESTYRKNSCYRTLMYGHWDLAQPFNLDGMN